MDRHSPDALSQICEQKLVEIERSRQERPLESLRREIAESPDQPRGFAAALKAAVAGGRCGLIAEIKRASPSGGLIRAEFDPVAIAHDYERAGATCLSVLTDGPYFGGSPSHLRQARRAVRLPVLRKDFMLDPWQVYESRAMGADCILIIMAAVADRVARDLEATARTLDMDVLVEVHDEQELDRALGLQSALIGINNRNLKTLQTDITTTVELSSHVPPDRVLISESGIRNNEDLKLLGKAGAQCLLVGESLLRQDDLSSAVHALLGTCATP